MRSTRGLRHPISALVNGQPTTLLTVGHVAAALGRTTTCLKEWERMGLFPPAPYRLRGSRARVYPEQFVKSISLIRDQGYVGRRLHRSDWERFQSEVWRAYKEALKTLRPTT